MNSPSPAPDSAAPPVVILGVTGSIAAYKAAELASQMVKRGWEVHVVMTRGAQEFITPLTLQTLSRNPVVTEIFESAQGWKPGHISLADQAALLLIAPATANILAELAHGLASNPITEITLATLAPVLLAPAMNGKMWEHAATRHNVELLRSRGVHFVGPEETGMLACGYEGAGRLGSVEEILARAAALLASPPRAAQSDA
jgi:phosphopantothenoylcysteine decarboxylase